ncbi:HAD family hydrolase [Kitasatospora sp. NBC_00458]|uniref:HAD family hydrolase n=1 Tax=Kitasatospora sp. NBC_00458 TaxID=2903568 RepID=UPI002E180280
MNGPAPAPIAFFDVDETLIAAKGMLAFWDHWTADPARAAHAHAHANGPSHGSSYGSSYRPSHGHPHDPSYRPSHGPRGEAPGAAPPAAVDLRAAMAAGVPREELNRMYYRRFAGVPAAALRSSARRWYDGYRRGAEAFVTAGLDAVARHRDLGHAVVLVSGSLRPLLEAVAEDLGADGVCCAEQTVSAGGVLTGEVDRPMIGRAKADAVVALLRARGVRPADCFAYGDHESDLAMLRSVGRPVVVNGSPGLVAEAVRAGWPVLDGRRGPRLPERPAARTAVGHRSVSV